MPTQAQGGLEWGTRPGYQTRINQILRRVMREGKKRAGEK